jgi:rhodanese-related sulfurtransferase
MNNLKLCLIFCGLAAGFGAGAITPAELTQRLDAGEPLTVIDVRATDFFQKGHIPGAINVPAAILAEKRLPKLGAAVVYDAGLGEDLATAAVALLNAKPGISAQALEGGLAAYEVAGGQTTADPGITVSQLPVISYAKLKEISGEYVVVDLRQPFARAKTAAAAAPPRADLMAEFPGAAVVKDPFAASAPRKAANGKSSGVAPLLVLIDSGDGTAQEMGRALKANGNKRFVILAGGEEMILRKGRSGLERSGSTAVFTGAEVPFLKNTNTNR